MDFELKEEHRMLKELVGRFVREQLLPLEPAVLARDAVGEGVGLTAEERTKVNARARELGLWGLDAPVEFGGHDLPLEAMIGVAEEIGHTVINYAIPPDSPNLHMLMAVATAEQRAKYVEPYARGEMTAAIAITEPSAGADPSGMITRAEQTGDGWLLNGRKMWIGRVAEADFTIVMAVTDKSKGARGGISAFLVERDTPGFNILRRIPMIGGRFTYEIAIEDCHLPAAALLGKVGEGFGSMQKRLSVRRLQMGAWCIGMAERALQMMSDHAVARSTFGVKLADRQAIQWWIADAAIRIHASRLMVYDAAWKSDQGRDVRRELSMIKVFVPEMATEVVDKAMQTFGAMGMAKEMPLHAMASMLRWIRVGEGPSEVHRWVVARSLLGQAGGRRAG